MPAMSRSALVAIGVLLVLLATAMLPPDALAHRGSSAVALDPTSADPASAAPIPALAMERLDWSAAPTPVAVPWPLMLTVAVLALIGARRPRPALAVALILVVAVFAFESGVHSVHHLGDRDRGEHCALAAVSQHLAGAEVDVVILVENLPLTRQLAVTDALIERVRLSGPDQGRAPPVAPA
jgi:hypothetical protein